MVVGTIRGGEDTKTLPALVKNELFPLTGGGNKKHLSHALVPSHAL